MVVSWPRVLFTNVADHTTLSSFTSEASLLGGTNLQPLLEAFYFDPQNHGRGKAVRLVAKGLLSCTGTPTYLFTVRLGTTAGSSYLAGTVVGVTAALTCQSGISNKQWELDLLLVCRTPGIGTNNCTLAGAGWLTCPGGLASPFQYPVQPSTPDTATWTATVDGGLAQYFNLTAACSASSASNAIVCKEIMLLGLN